MALHTNLSADTWRQCVESAWRMAASELSLQQPSSSSSKSRCAAQNILLPGNSTESRRERLHRHALPVIWPTFLRMKLGRDGISNIRESRCNASTLQLKLLCLQLLKPCPGACSLEMAQTPCWSLQGEIRAGHSRRSGGGLLRKKEKISQSFPSKMVC